jgi:hypothetical protein
MRKIRGAGRGSNRHQIDTSYIGRGGAESRERTEKAGRSNIYSLMEGQHRLGNVYGRTELGTVHRVLCTEYCAINLETTVIQSHIHTVAYSKPTDYS